MIELQSGLAEVLGEEHAMTLMRHLPQEEVATKADIAALKVDLQELEERVDLKLEALEHRMQASFHRELGKVTRTFVLASVGSMTTLAALAFAAARLT